MEPIIRTSTGRQFHLLEPWRNDPNIGEIAHALSHLCRFTGHTDRFYSVAQHSVHVSHLVPPALAMHGLLHDAAEAYLGDVASPLKALLPQYRELEAHIQGWICRAYGLSQDMPEEVKAADQQMLVQEMHDLFPRQVATGEAPHALPWPIEPWTPAQAREAFLTRFAHIGLKDRRWAA